LAALVSLVAVGAVGRGLLVSSATVSDVERLTVNRLTAVTVDIEATGGTARLSFDGMAPGDRATASLTLLNSGTAALRYALVLEGFPPAVAEHLRVDVWVPTPDCGDGRAGPPTGTLTLAVDRAISGSGATALLGDPASGRQPTDRTIDVGGTDRVCVSVRVELSAPNSIQGQAATGVLTALAEHDVEPA
jgi:hypothetical protein